MTRAVALTAVIPGGLALALAASSCLTMLCYEDESCADGGGGAGATAQSATAQSGMLVASTASGATVSQGGGGGGGGPDCDADLATDPAHCGACNNDCAGAACAAGVCGVASLDLDTESTEALGSPLVWNERVILPLARTQPNPERRIVSVPVDFSSTSGPTLMGTAAGSSSVVGMWSLGSNRAYFSVQTGTFPQFHVCDQVTCQSTAVSGNTHFNGSGQISNRLYVAEPGAGGAIKSLALQLDGGIISQAPRVDVPAMAQIGEGPQGLFVEPLSSNIVWITYGAGGCLHTQDAESFPLKEKVRCRAAPSSTGAPVALAASPQGDAFVALSPPTPPQWSQKGTSQMMPMGETSIRPPIAVDERYVYARAELDGENDGLVVIQRSTGELVAKLAGYPVVGIDATHPSFVFFVQNRPDLDNNQLFRWRKLPN